MGVNNNDSMLAIFKSHFVSKMSVPVFLPTYKFENKIHTHITSVICKYFSKKTEASKTCPNISGKPYYP